LKALRLHEHIFNEIQTLLNVDGNRSSDASLILFFRDRKVGLKRENGIKELPVLIAQYNTATTVVHRTDRQECARNVIVKRHRVETINRRNT